MEDKLKYATEREKEAYKLRQEGKTYKAIGEEMGISKSGAEHFVKNAERRIRSYDRHCETRKQEMEKFAQPIEFPLTYGDGELISNALYESLRNYEKEYKIRNDFTNPYRESNKSKLPYEYFLIRDLYERLNTNLGKPIFRA